MTIVELLVAKIVSRNPLRALVVARELRLGHILARHRELSSLAILHKRDKLLLHLLTDREVAVCRGGAYEPLRHGVHRVGELGKLITRADVYHVVFELLLLLGIADDRNPLHKPPDRYDDDGREEQRPADPTGKCAECDDPGTDDELPAGGVYFLEDDIRGNAEAHQAAEVACFLGVLLSSCKHDRLIENVLGNLGGELLRLEGGYAAENASNLSQNLGLPLLQFPLGVVEVDKLRIIGGHALPQEVRQLAPDLRKLGGDIAETHPRFLVYLRLELLLQLGHRVL